jgi:hypothetical protein
MIEANSAAANTLAIVLAGGKGTQVATAISVARQAAV